MFTVVFSDYIFEDRKNIIDKLNEIIESEKVKVYINKFETFVDNDNIYWKTVDIFISTKQKVDLGSSLRKKIFQNCYLRETISTNTGTLM